MKKESLFLSIVIHSLLFVIAYLVIIKSVGSKDEWVSMEFGSYSNSSQKFNRPHYLSDNSNKFQLPQSKNFGQGDVFNNYSENKDTVSSIIVADSAITKYGNGKFEIDFKGKRSRGIYNYLIPTYPTGVDKEVDLVFQITIAPDGTVQRVFPLMKADTRLEVATVNALNKWRFEPLPHSMPQLPQDAIVIFPYRLH
jgi:hypothetical protein